MFEVEEKPSLLSKFGLAILFIAFAGVLAGDISFGKLRVGPVYILELLTGFWVLANIRPLLRTATYIHKFPRTYFLILVFFAWGMTLFIADLFTQTIAQPMRFFQHAIIFAYPAIWITMGLVSYAHFTKFTVKLLWCILGLHVFTYLFWTLQYWGFHNLPVEYSISSGPLVSIVLVWLLTEFYNQKSWKFGLLSFAVGCFVFAPFWSMWGYSVQRTSLLQLIMLILFASYLYNKKSLRNVVLVACTAFLIFGIGLAIKSTYFSKVEVALQTQNALPEQKPSVISRLSNSLISRISRSLYFDFYESMQHGEDVNSPTEKQTGPAFQARFRKFSWETATRDWLESPVWGRGFVPEIPSYVTPERLNDGNFEYPGAPPISGPHNSFLTILARTGIIGFFIFVVALAGWLICAFNNLGIDLGNHLRKYRIFENLSGPNQTSKGSPGPIDLALFGIGMAGLIHGFFNVSLESPYRCALFWFCFGVVIMRAKKNDLQRESTIF